MEKISDSQHALMVSFLADLTDPADIASRKAALKSLPDLDPTAKYYAKI